MLWSLFLISWFLQGIENSCVVLRSDSVHSPNLQSRHQILSCLVSFARIGEEGKLQYPKFAACFWKVIYTNSLEQGGVFCS